MTRATYGYTVLGAFILVVDQDQGMSVTNDAEHVIADLARARVLPGRRVLYRDTDKHWDELVVSDGAFAGFAPLGATTPEEAIAKAEGRER
jgi:hypothetical protein